ncbi:MAG: dynamin family protein [Actinomycetaceae bacterium]|nr:dynamin family protein [Actinomycetaceae bacterium]
MDETPQVENFEALKTVLEGAAMSLSSPPIQLGEQARLSAIRRLSDHIIPRFTDLDAPLVAVVGGSTGAGKSTIVNSLLGQKITATSVLRPTTRRPVLLHNPQDELWFAGDRVFSFLTRVRVGDDAPATDPGHIAPGAVKELELRAHAQVPAGIAIIDTPDIDSLLEDNRLLAAQLLDVADLWLFVTTAARYADGAAWTLLRQAQQRNAVIAIVLSRVPSGAALEVRRDMEARMEAAGLKEAPLFLISETTLDNGEFLPADDIDPIARWLRGLASDVMLRNAVARQTLFGQIEEVLLQASSVSKALAYETEVYTRASAVITDARRAAGAQVDGVTQDGSLLRGEVLARWQEIVGTAEIWKPAQSFIARFRDSLARTVRGKPVSVAPVEVALGNSIATVLADEITHMHEVVRAHWEADKDSQEFADKIQKLDKAQLEEKVRTLVRTWQGSVLDLVRAQGASKLKGARILSLGVNALSVSLMLVIFAATGGITGAELGVAGVSAVVAQRILEMVFGDQAVRDMAKAGRKDLQEKSAALLDAYAQELEHLIERTARDVTPEDIDQSIETLRLEWDL